MKVVSDTPEEVTAENMDAKCIELIDGIDAHLKGEGYRFFPVLVNFDYSHLPEGPIQDTSKMFHDLAWNMFETLPPCAELSVGLRKVLEAKDCGVRAMVMKMKEEKH